MLLVLDSNEYIFAFGISKKASREIIVDTILDTFPKHTIRIPLLVTEEVQHHFIVEDCLKIIQSSD